MSEKLQVIVVENASYMVKFLHDTLHRQFDPHFCRKYEEAYGYLSVDNPPPLICDIQFAQNDTFNGLKKIAETFKNVRFLIICAPIEEQKVRMALKGAHVYIIKKPVNQHQCFNQIKEAYKDLYHATEVEKATEDNFESLELEGDVTDYIRNKKTGANLSAIAYKVDKNSIGVYSNENVPVDSKFLMEIADKLVAMTAKDCSPAEEKGVYDVTLEAEAGTNLVELMSSAGILESLKAKKKNRGRKKSAIELIWPHSVLVIDDDSFIRTMIVNALREQKIWDIDEFEDGRSGFEKSMKKRYDFIILDWVLPEINGMTLFNRYRKDPYYRNIPILILSGFVSKNDFSLLGDFHISELLEKPFQSSLLIRTVKNLQKEAVWYDSQEEKIAQLVLDLESGKIQDASPVIDFIIKSPNPYPLALIAGRIFKKRGIYTAAEYLFKYATKNKEFALMAFNELGKLYLLMGRNGEAKRILKKLTSVSPNNIERLCNLGNIALKEMNTTEAGKYFSQALDLDPTEKVARGGKKLVENIEQWSITTDEVPATFAGVLNAIGISMVRGNSFDDGIEHYKSALMHVHEAELKSKLSFNIGLALAKDKQLEESLPWFEKAVKYDKNFEKAQKYIDRFAKIYKPKAKPKKAKSNDRYEEIDDSIFDIEDEVLAPAPDQSKNKALTDAFARIEQLSKKVEKSERDKLVDLCPQLDAYFDLMTNEGIYVEGQLQNIAKILKDFGREKLGQAVLITLREKNANVSYLKTIVSKLGQNEELKVKIDPIIIIFDDMSPVIKETSENLKERGFKVKISEQPTAILTKAYEDNAPAPLMFLVNFHLSETEGLQVVKLIRKINNFKEVPVIMFGEHFTQVEAKKALSQGANDCISMDEIGAIVTAAQKFL